VPKPTQGLKKKRNNGAQTHTQKASPQILTPERKKVQNLLKRKIINI
jgi:hypothetical protein